MTPAVWSCAALLVAIVFSCTSRVNVGLLAFALAWLVGVVSGGLTPETVASGFPATLFVTLVGVTLLFSLADSNGTLEAIVRRVLASARDPRLLPPLVFLIAGTIAAAGPGGIAAGALVAPLAMSLARRTGASAFLMALMVCNGTNAGNLSPLSAVGIIARDAMAKAGLVGFEAKTFLANFLAHVLVGGAAWAVLAGRGPMPAAVSRESQEEGPLPALSWRQRLTLAILLLWVAGTLLAGLPVGFLAFVAAALMLVLGAADEVAALQRMPWGVILMVTGMTTLVSVLERTGGMDLFTTLLARVASASTLNGTVAFVTGAISTFSSTSAVVMPAFLPTARSLVEKVGGGDPLAVALSINVGSALVDVSPLSTLGALCAAAVVDPEAARNLFRKLLLWGLSMTLVGALLCQLFAGPLARV